MAKLKHPMPQVAVSAAHLTTFGTAWSVGKKFNKKQGMDFGKEFDLAVGTALADFLGNKAIVTTNATLLPPDADCVEVGPVRVVGGVRPQNYDVGYRPDGIRFVFDSKTLNDKKSIGKNWQNMINDIATEATTAHTRFPYAIVGFMLVCPKEAITQSQLDSITQTLERLATRRNVNDHSHLSEVISLVIWEAATGSIDPNVPHPDSILRIEKFSSIVEDLYTERYKGLPPHGK